MVTGAAPRAASLMARALPLPDDAAAGHREERRRAARAPASRRGVALELRARVVERQALAVERLVGAPHREDVARRRSRAGAALRCWCPAAAPDSPARSRTAARPAARSRPRRASRARRRGRTGGRRQNAPSTAQSPIVHVPGDLRVVRQRRVVADDAVVRDVRVGEEQVAVADLRVAAVLRGAGVDRHVLADHVVVADRRRRRLAAVLAVLRDQSPIDANWKMRLRSPIVVRPSITTCGPIVVPAPMRTVGADRSRYGADLDVVGELGAADRRSRSDGRAPSHRGQPCGVGSVRSADSSVASARDLRRRRSRAPPNLPMPRIPLQERRLEDQLSPGTHLPLEARVVDAGEHEERARRRRGSGSPRQSERSRTPARAPR